MDEKKIIESVSKVISNLKQYVEVPVGVSNRHIHLSKEDFDILFPNQEVEIFKELSQPGFYAATQTVTIIGNRGELQKVRLLVPLREKTQVELSKTDARIIGIDAPIRLSGQLDDATEITIKSDATSIVRPAAIIAKRHIHMNPTDAILLGFKSGDKVSVLLEGDNRRTIYDDVIIRSSEGSVLEMHIDTDEANAANCGKEAKARFL